MYDEQCPEALYYQSQLAALRRNSSSVQASNSAIIAATYTTGNQAIAKNVESAADIARVHRRAEETQLEYYTRRSRELAEAKTMAGELLDSLSGVSQRLRDVYSGKRKSGFVLNKDHFGHHMGDYLPQSELDKFNLKVAKAKGLQQLAAEMEQRVEEKNGKLTSANKGYGMLAKMGWSEGKSVRVC